MHLVVDKIWFNHVFKNHTYYKNPVTSRVFIITTYLDFRY
nr:MAG TPA: hypothetical protein [Caudoviricetes sp.]